MPEEDKRRVVVTGIGLLTAVGCTKESFWESIIKGESGIKKLTAERLDTSEFKTKIAATIDDFNPEDFIDPKEVDLMDPCSQLAVAATDLALKDSALKINPVVQENTGVILGSAVAGIVSHDNCARNLFVRGHRYVDPMTVPMAMFNAAAGNISHTVWF